MECKVIYARRNTVSKIKVHSGIQTCSLDAGLTTANLMEERGSNRQINAEIVSCSLSLRVSLLHETAFCINDVHYDFKPFFRIWHKYTGIPVWACVCIKMQHCLSKLDT